MPTLWKRENIKKCRMRGEAYINRSGKAIGQKRQENVDCIKCRFKCAYNFTEEQHIAICAEYWALRDTQKQKQMLSSLITTSVVVRRRTQATKPKQDSYKYHLKTCGGKLIRVCMKFLCKTLAISHRSIDDLHTLLSATGNYIGVDGRTGKKPANNTYDHSIAQVKAHIDSFPRMESHYCRRDMKRLYLSSDLNISLMHRLYQEQNVGEPVSYYVYKSMFNSYDSQLTFYAPKKDQCVKCNIYRSNSDKTEQMKAEWTAHKDREKSAMDMKTADKTKAIKDSEQTFRSVSFDLQSVLSTPHAAESQIYYKRKLTYNFTLFENHSKDRYCFVWDKINGKNGSNKIGTCLLKYLSVLPETVLTFPLSPIPVESKTETNMSPQPCCMQ
ncbi:uncharacterized protein [Diabrotica undecimpunctata]|uniref:uncharacterized protein n=1 Tax=Diabrotica undecimpunctata TaxID=50387 RepID=UPI003B632DD9